MNTKPSVSIILPIHNAGKHLHKCLTSLTLQTLQEIEIICVLDMPTDGSDQVVKNYALTDRRIIILENTQNLHIGCSRNRGIEQAKGAYIAFCDHDDFCEPTMFEKLYQHGKATDADIVVSNFWVEQKGQQLHFGYPKHLTNKEFQSKTLEAILRGERSIANTDSFANVNTIWHQIYKRNMIDQHSIRFDDNRICTYEDVCFNLQVYHHANKVSYLSENFYHHVLYDKNSFKSYEYNSIDKVLCYLDSLLSFVKIQGLDTQYHSEIAQQTLKRLYTSFRNEIKYKGIRSISHFLKRIKSKSNIQVALQPFWTDKKLLRQFPITKIIFLNIIKK